jgi:hypothetical protein
MENNIFNQTTKNKLIGKAVISFVLGVISGLVPVMMMFEKFIPCEETLKLNRVLEPYIRVLNRILSQLLPLDPFEFALFILLTSLSGLILGIMVLRSKPRRRLITGLGIGGIFLSLIGLIWILLSLPFLLFLASGP